MNVVKFREIIKKLSGLDPNAYSEIEACWKEEVDVLASDVISTMDFLNNQCTEDEFGWISEIIDDLIADTKSRELLECYKQLMSKYPAISAKYNIDYTIKCAEDVLKC